MNTEEKAKAYDEALNRAKKELQTCGSTDCDAARQIFRFFPTLRESEDERIRKDIINLIYWLAGNPSLCSRYYRDRYDGMLAWLEKQKELPFVKDVVLGLPGLYFYDGERMHFRGSPAMEEKQKENYKSADSISSDCESNAKCENRWHKVEDSLPDSTREVLCKDAIGNYFIGRYYSKGVWEVSMYDDCDKSNEDNPPVVKWCEIPSEKQKEQKPVKMEAYEVGKGTTICGQDYKCKKDYKEGNCRYIKDAIYHCGRDGYLTDQNGVSWSCTPEWFNEYIQSNTEWAEEEKTRFVSGQFLQCKLSFEGFKEGEHYWLKYVGDDMYVGRSDNILNQKFHITPRQLYTLFSQQLEEKQKEQKHPNGCFTCDEYKKGYEEGRRNGFTAGYNKAMKEVEQKEQKPAQSEEEKEYVRTLKGLVSDFIRDSGGGITDVEYYQNICDWLDGRHIEQKPVEYLSKDKVYAIISKLTKLSTSNLIPFNSPEYKKINEITSDIRSLLDYPIEQKPRWEINNPHTTKWTKEMIDEKFEELVKEYHKQKPVVTHGETYHVDTLGTQQVIAGKMPQKPAEWSKEDKAIISCIVCCLDGQFVTEAARKQCLEWFNQHRRDFLNQSKQEWSEEDENKIESIKGLITMGKFVDTNTIKTIWKLLDSLRPQPKVEWSEEDEEMLNSCICSIEESKENRYAYKETDGDTSYDREIAWLKSLPERFNPQPNIEICPHSIKSKSYLETDYPIEQKPAERSLEDDHIIGFVYDLLNEIEWKDDWAMSKDECLRLLSNYIPQKPAEWDDYTKTNLGRAIQIIKDARGTLHGYQTDDGIYECDKAIEALEHFLYRGLEIEKLAEWSEDIIRKAIKEVGLTQHQIDWFKTNVFPPKPEWSEEDEKIYNSFKVICERLIKSPHGEKFETDAVYAKKMLAWLKSLRLQPKQEWSKEDEKDMAHIIRILDDCCVYGIHDLSKTDHENLVNKLKSIRPQPKGDVYKEKNEAFKLGKQQLAIGFINYLDDNRPKSKMISNGECEDIDKAFKENDWAKILRYAEKYGK